ncbi:MAG: HAD family phosphatase [Clostridia bacterium]|nr:HAD family phosphatase [Clostridia bacterium]
MKKFEGMLFCTDLDGTIYSDDKTVSKQNLEAIEYFKSEGGLFTFITGRVPQTSTQMCSIIKPNAPIGCINGGGIYNPVQEKYLWKVFLPNEALELVRAVDEQLPEIGIQLNTEKAVYFNKDNEAMVWFRAITGLPNVSCSYEDVKEPIFKVVFAHKDVKQIEMLEKFLKNHPKAHKFDLICSEPRLYEILPKGVSKGVLLCKMAELLGIGMGKTIAVGDYYNDISMIKKAGFGFAVANALDEVKAIADYITVSNNDHAIAKIIDGFDRGIYKINF